MAVKVMGNGAWFMGFFLISPLGAEYNK